MLDLPKARVYGGAVAGALGELRADGQFFYLPSGEGWTAIECSDFSLYKRFLMGEDISRVLAQRADLGFNLLRVWLLNQSVVGRVYPGGIAPSQHTDFYDKLPEFLSLLARYGLRAELTAFTSTGTLMPDVAQQEAHLAQTAAAAAGHGAFLELVNEADQYDNACSTWLPRPRGIVCSRGSNGADSPPAGHDSPWDYELYHTNDLSEFQRKVGHNAMEWADQSKRPCISNENTRYPDKDNNPAHAFDAAAGAALLCAGSCFHSEEGKYSTLFGDSLECARQWVAGARSVPLEYRKGQYIHRQDLESGSYIRVYERRLPDGRGFIVFIRP